METEKTLDREIREFKDYMAESVSEALMPLKIRLVGWLILSLALLGYSTYQLICLHLT